MSARPGNNLQRAAEAQTAAILLASARGDQAEAARREASRAEIERRLTRHDRWDAHTASEFARLVRALPSTDGLRRLIQRGASGIGLDHLRAALVLRDHMDGSRSGASEIAERVDGGRIHNGQMEGLLDRRRPLRHALNAAIDAIEDQKLMPVAIEVIVTGRTPRGACDRHGVTWGGQMAPRICVAIVEALDAAAAHVGISR
jgi:hypothetical protein